MLDDLFEVIMFVLVYFAGILTVLLALVLGNYFRERNLPNARVSPFLKKCSWCNGTGARLDDLGSYECYYCRGTGLTIDPPQ